MVHACGGQLLELGERIGDVAQERWKMVAQTHIEKIPTRVWAAEDDAEGCVMCIVCQEDVQVGEVVTSLPCRHEFHSECCEGWLAAHHTCPTCKVSIKPATPAKAALGAAPGAVAAPH